MDIDKRPCKAQDEGMPKAPDLIGSAEVCDLLQIDRSTLSRWVAFKKLSPALRLPGPKGAMLFSRSEIEKFQQAGAA